MKTTIFEQPGSYAPSAVDEAPEERSSREAAAGVQYGVMARQMLAPRSKAAKLGAHVASSAVMLALSVASVSTLISHKSAAAQDNSTLPQAFAGSEGGESSVLAGSWTAADTADSELTARLQEIKDLVAAFRRGEAPPPDAELDALADEVAKKDRFALPATGWAARLAHDVIDADD
ncbi:MAG: hypothetical protein M9894_39645 [Planctomycetes bacterium]|nr:hypothetical protein [Planctomycetota bacterium]